MEIKILQVFYGKDGLPYKDKDRTVHFPIVGTGFLGASSTTKIRFYYDELDNLDETTWVAVSKLPNGKIGSRVLESYTDEELNEHYALLELDSFYTQYKGKVYISLQGYQGGVQVDFNDETQLYTINGTPTIAATGSINFTINYANQFVGSGQTDNVTLQRVLADLGTKLGIRARSEHVDELPTVGESDVFYVINNDLNDPNKANIYIWNAISEHYVWVGDNTLDLGNYYTQEQGDQFESGIDDRVASVENELSSVAQGSPKGTYATLADLQAAYPTGTTGIYVVSATGYWYYWNGSAWTAGGTYLSSPCDKSFSKTSSNAVENKVVANAIEEGFDILQSKNLFDNSKRTDNYYVPYTTGIPVALSGYCYSDYIDVEGLSNVAFGRSSKAVIGSFHCCFYDYNYNFISGALATTDQPYVSVPSNAKYLIFSCGMSQAPEVVASKGTTPIIGVNYCYCMRIVVPKTKSDVDIELPDASYLRYWLNTVGGMGNKKHNINLILPKGTYNMNNYFSDAESASSSFKGLFVPNYVTLVGDGQPEDVILDLVLNEQNSQLSTLNLAGTAGLKNLTVKGTNTRYAVHDDFATPDYGHNDDYYYRNVENCIFTTTNAVYGVYGSGTRSGAIWKFKNCIFKGFSWHSNVNFELPNDITFENCVFKSTSYQGVILKTLGSGVNNKIHFIGCNIPMITCTEETTDIGYDFNIDGHGNNDVPVHWVNANHPIQEFSDKICMLQSNTTYSKGLCIYKVSNIFGRTNSPYELDGILLQDAVNGDYVKILTKGYYMARDLNLDSLASGTLLKINDTGTSLVAGTTSDKIVGRISTQWQTKFVKLF